MMWEATRALDDSYNIFINSIFPGQLSVMEKSLVTALVQEQNLESYGNLVRQRYLIYLATMVRIFFNSVRILKCAVFLRMRKILIMRLKLCRLSKIIKTKHEIKLA